MRHSDGLGLLTINLHQLLRIVGREAGEETREIFPLAAGSHDLVRDCVKVLQSIAAQVLQLKLEAAETSDALNRGRLKGDHDGPGDAEKLGETRATMSLAA